MSSREYWNDHRRYKQRQALKMTECRGCGCNTHCNHICVRCNTWNGSGEPPEADDE